MEIQIPHAKWEPRAHQANLWEFLQAGGKRALAVWHRRAGKDEILLNHAATSMIHRPGNYWHCLPEFAMARRAIWTSINTHTGRRRIDEAFPPDYRESVNDHEMFLRFHNGSTWQLIGSDRYDQTVGASTAGITYSEWALANPSAWGYHRPILEENNGWAAFITTPRGRNHAFELYKHAQKTPGWFCERLTALDTHALSSDQLDEALAEYQALYGEDVGRAQFEQEYLCNWNAAILGAFYALEMARVRQEERILDALEPIADEPIHRAWDLGTKDDTSIWMFQVVGAQIFILDHYAASGVGVEHYRDVLLDKYRHRGWRHGDDYVPHDAAIKEWGSGRTRVETMQQLGLRPVMVTRATLDDGINAARQTLPLCVFHARCGSGIEALEQYRREWDDDKKAFRANPVHDWTSHPADAFRYLSLAWKKRPPRQVKERRPTLPSGWMIPPPPEPGRGLVL